MANSNTMFHLNGKKKALTKILTEIRGGATAEDLANFYGVSEEVFMERFEERLGERFSEYKRLLDSKAQERKRLERRSKSSKVVKSVNDGADDKSVNEVSMSEMYDEYNSETIETLEETPEEKRQHELERVISECRNLLEELRTQYTDKNAEITRIDEEAEAIQQRLLEYANKIKKEQEEATRLSKMKSQLIEDSSKILANISENEQTIENAEIELDSYRKVVISFVDSVIQISKDGFDPLADEIENKFLDLSNTEPYADYSARNLRKASEVLCAIENIELMGLMYEIDYAGHEIVKEIVDGVLKTE